MILPTLASLELEREDLAGVLDSARETVHLINEKARPILARLRVVDAEIERLTSPANFDRGVEPDPPQAA